MTKNLLLLGVGAAGAMVWSWTVAGVVTSSVDLATLGGSQTVLIMTGLMLADAALIAVALVVWPKGDSLVAARAAATSAA